MVKSQIWEVTKQGKWRKSWGMMEEGLQWMYVFPVNSQQMPEGSKGASHTVILGSRCPGREKGLFQALLWEYD